MTSSTRTKKIRHLPKDVLDLLGTASSADEMKILRALVGISRPLGNKDSFYVLARISASKNMTQRELVKMSEDKKLFIIGADFAFKAEQVRSILYPERRQALMQGLHLNARELRRVASDLSQAARTYYDTLPPT